MFLLLVIPCRLAPIECLLADVAYELFSRSVSFLILPQVPWGAGSLMDLSFLPPRLKSNGTVPPASLLALPLAWLMTKYLIFGGAWVRIPLGPVAGGLGEPIGVVRLGRG